LFAHIAHPARANISASHRVQAAGEKSREKVIA
jgi:hypothetical protein